MLTPSHCKPISHLCTYSKQHFERQTNDTLITCQSLDSQEMLARSAAAAATAAACGEAAAIRAGMRASREASLASFAADSADSTAALILTAAAWASLSSSAHRSAACACTELHTLDRYCTLVMHVAEQSLCLSPVWQSSGACLEQARCTAAPQ